MMHWSKYLDVDKWPSKEIFPPDEFSHLFDPLKKKNIHI